MATQNALFPGLENKPQRLVPEGFRYEENNISEAEETELVASLATLELRPFEFHGHLGNRRVGSFGLRYDYSPRSVETADRFPLFLGNLRHKVAKFAGRRIDELQQSGVNEYPPGAGIGWHKDKSEFGVIVGVSLLARATMRFRRKERNRWVRMSQTVQPRSIYILEGEARTMWEHSIHPWMPCDIRSPFGLSRRPSRVQHGKCTVHLLTHPQLAKRHFLELGPSGLLGGLAPNSGLYVGIRKRESTRMTPMPSA
jgi:alkylated DNA repair dioxygenase AlkB